MPFWVRPSDPEEDLGLSSCTDEAGGGEFQWELWRTSIQQVCWDASFSSLLGSRASSDELLTQHRLAMEEETMEMLKEALASRNTSGNLSAKVTSKLHILEAQHQVKCEVCERNPQSKNDDGRSCPES
ncbi:hypothetical protein MLD38_024799 [Melastoma candidum]|uniref:Uncharacterized protein n=1 Tax=Melastoma candidum TaxID=119954 RepID=A0ACB9NTD7_9MYRT|nr:hypothetical protein MLD38_024799 [Melastoma candidum]